MTVPFSLLPAADSTTLADTDLTAISQFAATAPSTRKLTLGQLKVVVAPTIDPRLAPYNCAADGVTDDTIGLQAAVTAAISTKRLIHAQGLTFRITSPLVINNTNYTGWPIFQVGGETSGSAIAAYQERTSGRSIPGTAILCDSCSGLIVTLDNFYNESVKLGGVTFYGINTQTTTFGVQFRKNSAAYIRKQIVADVNFVGFRTAIEFLGLSGTATDNYIGTLVLEKFHTYLCGTGISFNNVYPNLCQIQNSLIHSCTDYGLKFTNGGAGGGGVIGIINTHFEDCQPAAYKTSGAFTTLALHNATTELCGVASGNGAWDLGANTLLYVSGNTTIPGTSEVPPVLPGFCELYASVPATIRSAGGYVGTPSMVTQAPSASTPVSFCYFPLEQQGVALRNTALFPFAPAGGGTNIPASIAARWSFTAATTVYDEAASSIAALGAVSYVVVTFLYKTASGANEGLNTGSSVTIGGVATALSTAFTLAKNIPLVCQVVVRQPVGSAITALKIVVRNPEYATSAWVSQEIGTRTMLALGHPG